MLFAVRFITLLLNQLLCGNPSNPISCPQCSVLIHYKRKKLFLFTSNILLFRHYFIPIKKQSVDIKNLFHSVCAS